MDSDVVPHPDGGGMPGSLGAECRTQAGRDLGSKSRLHRLFVLVEPPDYPLKALSPGSFRFRIQIKGGIGSPD